MRGPNSIVRTLVSGAVVLLALFVGGCDSDSPTTPVSQPVAPANPTPASSAWSITVSTTPSSVDMATGGTVVLEIRARRTGTNQLAPEGTTAILSASLGTLLNPAGGNGTSIPIAFGNDGVARASLLAPVFSVPTTIVVRAQLESSFGTGVVELVEVLPEFPVPAVVTSVSPNFGPPTGGTPIIITGTNFVDPVQVSWVVQGRTFFLTDARLSGSGTIRATTPAIDLPAASTASATVSVSSGAGTENPSTTALSGAFVYTRNGSANTMKILSVSPNSGPNEGGTVVEILGEQFPNDVRVFFSNSPLIAGTVLSITPTRLSVVTPAATGPNAFNADALVDVRVEDPSTGDFDVLSRSFQYGTGGTGALFISSVSPSEDEYLGGTLVTIFGQGFDSPVAISAGGEAQSPRTVSGTEIVFLSSRANIACSPQSGATSVTNIETAQGFTGPTFTYVPVLPEIISIDPNEGGFEGGTSIIVNGVPRTFGRGFVDPVRATIDGVLAEVTGIGPNLDDDGLTITGRQQEVTVLTPGFTGTQTTQPCTQINGQPGVEPAPQFVDVTLTNIDTGCSVTVADGFQYRTPPTTNACVPSSGTLQASFTFVDNGGGVVTFTDTSTAASGARVETWTWNFGDMTPTSPVQNPVHVYAVVPGTYPVTLTITDDIGSPAVLVTRSISIQ